MKTYNKLADLLEGDTPYHFGRALYKYTDCGAWVAFIVTDKPARTETATVTVSWDNGHLAAIVEGSSDKAKLDALCCLGFGESGDSRSKSLSRFVLQVKRFQRGIERGKIQHPMMGIDKIVTNYRPVLTDSRVMVKLSRQVAATTKDVYYERAPKRIKRCIGIRIGSIVEGWDDGYIEPIDLMFPFTEEQLDQAVNSINSDACACWDWANVPRDSLGRKHRNGKTDMERGLDCPLF